MTDVSTQDKFFVVYSKASGRILNICRTEDEALDIARAWAIGQPTDKFFILESTWLIHASPPTAVVNPIVAAPSKPSEVDQPVDCSHLLQWRFDPGKGYWTALSRHLRSDGVPYTWVVTRSLDWLKFTVLDGPGEWDQAYDFDSKAGVTGYCQNIEDNIVGPAYRKGE